MRRFAPLVFLLGLLAADAAPAPEPAAAPVALPPVDLVRQIRLARIHERAGRTGEALAVLRSAVEAHPAQPGPLLAWIELLRRSNGADEDLAEVRGRLARLLASPDVDLSPHVLAPALASADFPEDELRTVRERLEARLAARPESAETLEMLADVHARLGDRESERAVVARLETLRPSREIEWRALALDSMLERWDGVVARASRMLAESPSDDGLRFQLVRAAAAAGRVDVVASEEKPLLGRRGWETSLSHGVYLPLAWSHWDAGRDVDAENAFRRALALDAENRVAADALAALFGVGGDSMSPQALDDRWERIDNPVALVTEGAMRLAGGDPVGAVALLTRAVAIAPDDPIAHYNLGIAEAKLERWDRAIAALERATSLGPGRAEAWLAHGRALHGAGRPAEAIPSLEKALALRPDLARAHDVLWRCHAALGNREASERHRKLFEASEK